MKMRVIELLVLACFLLSGISLLVIIFEDDTRNKDPRNAFFKPPYVRITDKEGNISLMPFEKALRQSGNVQIQLFPGVYNTKWEVGLK